jgi:formylglycine-generating enzyme required for sulfatase activity
MAEPDKPQLPEAITVGGTTGATGAPVPDSTRTLAADLLAESGKTIEGATAATMGAAPAAPARPLPTEVEGYRLGRQLGAGGMGLVFEAVHERLKRTVALKLLKPEAAGRKEFTERFLRESKAMAAVQHPNVVSIFDAGEQDGYLYMALEFVPGGDLSRLVQRRGPLEWRQAVEIMLGCARGLAAIHAAGLVHRDIKPQNIFLDRDLRPKIGDLGLARSADGADRMTMTGAAWGTPAYMSPEQVRGVADVDLRTDVYALGSTLFTILTGTEPFSGATAYIVTHKVLTEAPPDPRAHNHLVPPAIAAITMKAMAKDREERYRDCEALAQDLERARDGKPLLHASVIGVMPAAEAAELKSATAAMTSSAQSWSPPALSPGLLKVIALVVVAGILWAAYRSMAGQTTIDRAAVRRDAAAADGVPAWATGDGSDAAGRWVDLHVGVVSARLRWCPPGSFTMGSADDEDGREPHETRHQVTLTRGFWICETECTRALWREVMGAAADDEGDPQQPQAGIDLDDCRAFLTALAKRAPGAAARLPTEAEWEYACRAHAGDAFGGGRLDGHGWAADGKLLAAWREHAGEPGADVAVAQAVASERAELGSHPVAQAKANAWGLFDMHGNVAEWCADSWDGITPLPNEAETDPLRDDGGLAVVRGGSWWVPPERCRSASRAGVKPSTREPWLGLRFVIP